MGERGGENPKQTLLSAKPMLGSIPWLGDHDLTQNRVWHLTELEKNLYVATQMFLYMIFLKLNKNIVYFSNACNFK